MKMVREEANRRKQERESVGRGCLLVTLQYNLSIALLIPPHILRAAWVSREVTFHHHLLTTLSCLKVRNHGAVASALMRRQILNIKAAKVLLNSLLMHGGGRNRFCCGLWRIQPDITSAIVIMATTHRSSVLVYCTLMRMAYHWNHSEWRSGASCVIFFIGHTFLTSTLFSLPILAIYTQ